MIEVLKARIEVLEYTHTERRDKAKDKSRFGGDASVGCQRVKLAKLPKIIPRPQAFTFQQSIPTTLVALENSEIFRN